MEKLKYYFENAGFNTEHVKEISSYFFLKELSKGEFFVSHRTLIYCGCDWSHRSLYCVNLDI